MEIAQYQFHSWTRKGIAGAIVEKDDLGSGSSTTKNRVPVTVSVALNGTAQPKDFSLIGPGDIIGVNPNMIVRTSPLNRITNFEPNYLALAEFYDEDFLWRYTPAAPQGEKLRPWLFLLVIQEEEFERTQRLSPVPTINIKTAAVFPPATETWLWAHVHNDMNIPADQQSNFANFVDSLNNNAGTDPDQLYCRLLSPRKLEAGGAYYAFLVPAFESGRLAGLEQPTDSVNAQASSWTTGGANGEMPVYFEWYFRTGLNEDFESLAKKLTPQAMDPKVGVRDMDASNPGFIKADGTSPFPGTSPAVLGLEGALKAPTTVSTVFPSPLASNAFQVELQTLVNLPFTITGTSGDPIISAPLYGNMYAKTSASDIPTLDITKNSWLHTINKDPRTRVAAGFGTLVLQKNQERYMRTAWAQVQTVIEANKRIRNTLFYMKISNGYAKASFSRLNSAALLSFSQPVLGRIMGATSTILQQIRESQLPVAVFSGSFTKLLAPGKRIAKITAAQNNAPYQALVTGLNNGTMTAAPVKIAPGGSITIKDLADKITVAAVAAALTDPQIQLDGLGSIAPQPLFSLVLSVETSSPPPTPTTPGADSVEAKNYRQALTDMTKRLAFNVPVKPVVPFNMMTAVSNITISLDPQTTFPKRLSSLVKFPGTVALSDPANIYTAMAYPDIADPMYKGLAGISSELLLPNLQLVPENCISLLNTNPGFIESYMVGLNHEMGRELLWREFPTDERGSYFRQFWDSSGLVAPVTGQTPAQQSAAAKDITPIDSWGPDSLLGSHNNRGASGETQLVLVIRGELLKKYPAVISVQKAITDGAGGTKILTDFTNPDDFAKNVHFPLYKGELDPDIKFFGFDLTMQQALGTVTSAGFPGDSLGWYFVIMQIPGAPSFGMDISFSPDNPAGPFTWDDLSWDKLPPGTNFITGSMAPSLTPSGPVWGADAASMASILFQQPVMVAIHASQMLGNLAT